MELYTFFDHIRPLKIVGGGEHFWRNVYPAGWYIDFENDRTIVIDTETNILLEVSIYEADLQDDDHLIIRRWINPDCLDDYLNENKRHKYEKEILHTRTNGVLVIDSANTTEMIYDDLSMIISFFKGDDNET